MCQWPRADRSQQLHPGAPAVICSCFSAIAIRTMVKLTTVSSVYLAWSPLCRRQHWDVVGNTVAVSLFAWQQSQAITRPAWYPQISTSVCCRFKGPQRNRSLRGGLRCSAARTQECRSHVVEELHCDRTVGFGHTPPPGVVALPTKPSNEAWDRVGGAMRYGCVCIAQTTGASRVGTVACARPSGNAHAPAQGRRDHGAVGASTPRIVFSSRETP